MIKNVIFDLDDTLYREWDYVYNGFKEVAGYLGDKFSLDEEIIMKSILDIYEKDGRGKIFNILLKRLGLEDNIERLVKIYRLNDGKIQLYDDAKEFIDNNRDKYNFGIITDGASEAQWNKIRLLGLQKKVDKIVVTDDLGREFWKPHKKSYEIMLDYFGGEPDKFVYIGDNPKKDFVSANKLGMKTVRIIRDSGDYMDFKKEIKKKCRADKNILSFNDLRLG